MIILLTGPIGAGKSLENVRYAYLYNKNKKRPIVANFELIGIPYIEFNMKDFVDGKYYDSMVIIDEIYQYIEARNSSWSTISELFSYIAMQSRKLKLEVFCTTQLERMIDVRFREIKTFEIKCRTNITRQISDTLKLMGKKFFDVYDCGRLGFHYYLFEMNSNKPYKHSFVSLKEAYPYMQMYKTEEVIFEDNLKPSTFNLLSEKERKKVYKKEGKIVLEQWINEFNEKHPNAKKVNKITRQYVKVFCFEKFGDKFPTNAVSMIFNYAKYYQQ